MTDTIETDAPNVGSALRKYVSDRRKEVEGWQSLDGFLKSVGDVEAHLASKRRMLDELNAEVAEPRARAKAARSEGEQIAADAAAEAERLTGALLDRLTHHVNILEMNGDSYRLNQSRSRDKNAAE